VTESNNNNLMNALAHDINDLFLSLLLSSTEQFTYCNLDFDLCTQSLKDLNVTQKVIWTFYFKASKRVTVILFKTSFVFCRKKVKLSGLE